MFGISDCERIINLLILSIYNLPENLMRVPKRKFNVGSSVNGCHVGIKFWIV